MGERIKVKVPRLPTESQPELVRPLEFERIVSIDPDHEVRRKRYGYEPILPHLFIGNIYQDNRLVGKFHVYLPMEIEKVKITVQEIE